MQDFPLTLSQGADERMLKALIAECWAQDPAERPAFDGILERISASLQAAHPEPEPELEPESEPEPEKEASSR